MKIKVNDKTIEKLRAYAKERLEKVDHEENTTMCEFGQRHELEMLLITLDRMELGTL